MMNFGEEKTWNQSCQKNEHKRIMRPHYQVWTQNIRPSVVWRAMTQPLACKQEIRLRDILSFLTRTKNSTREHIWHVCLPSCYKSPTLVISSQPPPWINNGFRSHFLLGPTQLVLYHLSCQSQGLKTRQLVGCFFGENWLFEIHFKKL
jgi:hypothetical protein